MRDGSLAPKPELPTKDMIVSSFNQAQQNERSALLLMPRLPTGGYNCRCVLVRVNSKDNQTAE